MAYFAEKYVLSLPITDSLEPILWLTMPVNVSGFIDSFLSFAVSHPNRAVPNLTCQDYV